MILSQVKPVAPSLGMSIPPLALVAVGALVWLLLSSRQREDRKYAGLRILR